MTIAKKILVTRAFPEKGLNRLREAGFDLTLPREDDPMSPDELIAAAQGHDALMCTLTETLDAGFFAACSHLDMVSQFAVGYDNIDVAAATAQGIPVGYTPEVMTHATADIAFGLMIATARKMFFLHKGIEKGEWGCFQPTRHLGMELSGKTLGIFGMGRIGHRMAQLCRGAYGMDILYTSPSPKPEMEAELGARRVSFDALLADSDVVSAHCVLSRETRGIFNAEAFQQMKDSAIFINTARGPVHNEADLIAALESGTIWGAGLDVTDPEPMAPDNPLFSMERVSVLPHIGSATHDSRDGMSLRAAENIVSFYRTGKMPFIVNPRVLD
ncbi:MAG: D-glycerate dehydrogenase [Desulfobacterales bacterium]|nr:D-glycerate dehydrogenase [Desulfobacterales bacterium]